LVGLPGMPSGSNIKKIGWLTLPKAFIGLKGQFQALANLTSSTSCSRATVPKASVLQ
jgi:hypothetical protein